MLNINIFPLVRLSFESVRAVQEICWFTIEIRRFSTLEMTFSIYMNILNGHRTIPSLCLSIRSQSKALACCYDDKNEER